MESDWVDTFSLAPRSQEGNILSHDEICSPVSSRRPHPSCAKPEHDIKSEGTSSLRGREDMGTSDSSRRMV
jgi:hypothetical protein